MNRETIRAMLRALPEVKEDGDTVHMSPSWEVTLHIGRGGGAAVSVQQVVKVALSAEFLVAETYKEQRVVVLLDEVRGFAAEPSTTDRSKGRKPGFV